jgi:hypothetical protein
MNDPVRPRKSGLGALINMSQGAGTNVVDEPGSEPGTARGREGEKGAPARVPAPPSGGDLPKKIGNAEVRLDSKSRPYIKKTINFPLDLGAAIQARVGSHRRERDGEIAYDFQEVVLDALRLGLDALEQREGAAANHQGTGEP